MYSFVDGEEFIDWLYGEMRQRGWGQSDLARASDLSRGAVGNVLRGERKPGKDFLSAIARGLGYPPEIVFRAAGILPPVAPVTDLKERILHVFDRLPPDQQEQLADFADFLTRRYGYANYAHIHQEGRGKRKMTFAH